MPANGIDTEKTAYRHIQVGDPAPWFVQANTSNAQYAFSTVGGRYVLLCFLGSAGDADAQAVMGAVIAHGKLFDDKKLCFFGVSVDPSDQALGRLREYLPGQRHFWDFDGVVSRLYGALPVSGKATGYRRFWLLLDPTLRVLKVFAFDPGPEKLSALFRELDQLPPPGLFAGVELMAPVLYLPNVFEPALCQRLIDLFEAAGSQDSGFMKEVDGQTKGIHDYGFKRRRDHTITDMELIRQVQNRIALRINPEMQKAYNFSPTRMERYIVGCYTAEDGGHFRPHRDNTTKGTAHRKFAVTINLNSAFEGGELSFPEYGPRQFKPPPGGAVVFGCGLLHTVSHVTRGKRYAFLPFLYDDAAAKQREMNNPFLHPSVGDYKA